MPIVTASNGIRPEYRALAVIQLNKPVTPTEINDCVGTGDYAAKYISFLRRDGFVFDTTKDGRRIVSYTLIAEPVNVAYFRGLQPKRDKLAEQVKREGKTYEVLKAKGELFSQKAAKAKAKVKTEDEIKAANLATMQKVSAKISKKVAASKPKKRKVVDYVEKELGSTGEIATSFTVDGDWDSMEGVNIKALIG
jgi:hypothetical protein